jgi:hypothetical protein
MHSHLARFGLEVHIGQIGNPSKFECVFFPPPQFFNHIQSSAPALTDDVDPGCSTKILPQFRHSPQHYHNALSLQNKKDKRIKERSAGICPTEKRGCQV